MTATTEENKIQIRLFSRSPDIPLEDVILFVPTNLKRYGLSEIVYHLLSLEKPQPFEFLIEGKLLLSDIQSYLNEKNWSTENILTLEVIHATNLPKLEKQLDHKKEWISSINTFKNLEKSKNYIFSTEFNGNFNIWNENQSENLLRVPIGDGDIPIKNFDTYSDKENDIIYIFFAKGFQGYIYKMNHSKKGEDDNHSNITSSKKTGSKKRPDLLIPNIKLMGQTDEHFNTIEQFICHPTLHLLTTCSWDKTIRVYKKNLSEYILIDEEMNKKKRGLEEVSNALSSVSILDGHSGPVHCIHWKDKNSSSSPTLFSGSWDHSIRIWDMNLFQTVETRVSPTSVFCIDHSNNLGCLISGHADHQIRLWDTKSKDANHSHSLVFHGHTGFVNKVQWSKSNPHNFYSISHDGSLRVWDVRSQKTIHSVKIADGGKLFALHQSDDNKTLYVGGEDGILVQFSI